MSDVSPLPKLLSLASLLLSGCGSPNHVEPAVKGRPLSEWVILYAATDPDLPAHKEAEGAIRRIGTNAIPFLVDWIATATEVSTPGRLSAWEMKDPRTRAMAAPAAFTAFQDEALPVIPALERILTEGSDLASAYAAEALGRIGKAGLQPLTAALNSPRPGVRKNAADFMIFMGTNACPAIPALQKLRADPAPQVREAVSNILAVLERGKAHQLVP